MGKKRTRSGGGLSWGSAEVATAYEVSVQVHISSSVTAVEDVLTQTLHETDKVSEPAVFRSGDTYPVLHISMTVNANDSSEAGLAARRAIDDAVRNAGLSEDAVTVDAPEIRASS
jgi:flagellar basal body P-ring protein FlgI